MFDITEIASATYTATGFTAWQDTGDLPDLNGQWVKFLISNVIGLPNAKLVIQTSPDQLSVMDNSTWDGEGTGSPLINLPRTASILFTSQNRYWRAGWIFYANDPLISGTVTGNSSSSSGQSAISSSSSGGSAAITLSVGLVPGRLG